MSCGIRLSRDLGLTLIAYILLAQVSACAGRERLAEYEIAVRLFSRQLVIRVQKSTQSREFIAEWGPS